MDPGTALGIASLGIQVCEGILKYYDKWRSYDTDIRDTYKHITELRDIFAHTRLSLDKISYDKKRSDHARDALQPCEESLLELQELLIKLKPYNAPSGAREGAWAQFRRATYPLKASTLTRLREIDEDIRDRLALALQALQIDIAAVSQAQLSNIERDIESVDVSLKQVVLETHATAGGVETLLRAEEQRKLEEILKWLSPDIQDPWLDHKRARERHQSGTGDWLLTSQSYKAWKGGQTSHVWLHGKAGCGKTVLCSTAIEDMRQDYENAPSVGFAIFFFSFADQKKQSVDDMLLCLVTQLARKPAALPILVAAYEKHKNGASVNAPLEKIVRDQIDALTETVIFLDALDECPETAGAQCKLLSCLESIASSTHKLGLFATSRDETLIRDAMQAINAEVVSIDVGKTNKDIDCFVQNEVQSDPRLQRFDPSIRFLIQTTLSEKADGMFRWAYCQLEELKNMKARTAKKVKEALDNLPRTLYETYDRMLARIAETDRREATVILRWLVVQERPMTLVELAETCIIHPGSGIICEDDRIDPESILDLLGSLVVTTQVRKPSSSGLWNEVPALLPAHFSVQEYLETSPLLGFDGPETSFKIDRGRSHAFVADSCLVYMRWSCSSLHHQFSGPFEEYKALPLLRYARESWLTHSTARSDGSLENECRLLLNPTDLGTIYTKYPYLVYFMYQRAIHQLPQVRPKLCRMARRPDPTWDPQNVFSLHGAARIGLTEVVVMRLAAGADIEREDEYGNTALSYAAGCGFPDIVRLLLDAGADIEHIAPLCEGARGGHIEVVRLLLDAEADIENGRPLNWAISRGHVDIVELLVERGADVGGDLLHHVRHSPGPKLCLIAYLLSKGADVTYQDEEKRTPLHCLDDDLVVAVGLLLDNGADIEARDDQANTPLLSALQDGRYRFAQCLIEQGADVAVQNHRKGTPLHYLSDDLGKVLGLVLSKGASIEARDDHADTPLLSALRWSHFRLAQCLVEQGADIDAKSSRGESALHLASGTRVGLVPHLSVSQNYAVALVDFFLEAGAYVDETDDSGETPLHKAARASSVDLVQCLLDHGASICATTNCGVTPLTIVRSTLDGIHRDFGGTWSVVDVLIDRSDLADLQTRDGNGREVLHEAVRWGRPEIVQKLLERGIDMTAKTASGNSPIAIAKQTLAQLHSLEERAFVGKWIDGVQRVIECLSPHVAEEEGPCEEYHWTNEDRRLMQRAVHLYVSI